MDDEIKGAQVSSFEISIKHCIDDECQYFPNFPHSLDLCNAFRDSCWISTWEVYEKTYDRVAIRKPLSHITFSLFFFGVKRSCNECNGLYGTFQIPPDGTDSSPVQEHNLVLSPAS